MHLEMRFEANGDVRPIWYGRFMVNGKRQCVNLGVKLQGSPPASRKLRDLGDPLFEAVTRDGEGTAEGSGGEARSVRDSARLVEKLYAIKTGAKVRAVRLVDLAREWEDLPRKRAVAGQYATENRKILHTSRCACSIFPIVQLPQVTMSSQSAVCVSLMRINRI